MESDCLRGKWVRIGVCPLALSKGIYDEIKRLVGVYSIESGLGIIFLVDQDRGAGGGTVHFGGAAVVDRGGGIPDLLCDCAAGVA